MMAVTAQDNTWEQAEKQEVKGNPDQKYLTGAVPEVNGNVVFETTIKAPGKSGKQIYDIMQQLQENDSRSPTSWSRAALWLEDPSRKAR